MENSSEIFSIPPTNPNMSSGRCCSPVKVQGIAPSVLVTSIEFQGITSPRPELHYSQAHWCFAPGLGPISPKGHIRGAGQYLGLELGHKLDHILSAASATVALVSLPFRMLSPNARCHVPAKLTVLECWVMTAGFIHLLSARCPPCSTYAKGTSLCGPARFSVVYMGSASPALWIHLSGGLMIVFHRVYFLFYNYL